MQNSTNIVNQMISEATDGKILEGLNSVLAFLNKLEYFPKQGSFEQTATDIERLFQFVLGDGAINFYPSTGYYHHKDKYSVFLHSQDGRLLSVASATYNENSTLFFEVRTPTKFNAFGKSLDQHEGAIRIFSNGNCYFDYKPGVGEVENGYFREAEYTYTLTKENRLDWNKDYIVQLTGKLTKV